MHRIDIDLFYLPLAPGQPHEGSCYASQKDLQMAMHRSEHVKSRLSELEKIKQEHLRQKHPGMVRSYSIPESQTLQQQPHTPQQQQPHTPQPQQQQKQRDQQREQQAQL